LQYTAQQLGSSLGTAFLGAVVITGLAVAFSGNVAGDARISPRVNQQVEQKLSAGGSFVSAEEARAAAESAGVDAASTDLLVQHYEDAQLKALKTAFLFAAFLTVASFWSTRRLPAQRFDQLAAVAGRAPPQPAPEPSVA